MVKGFYRLIMRALRRRVLINCEMIKISSIVFFGRPYLVDAGVESSVAFGEVCPEDILLVPVGRRSLVAAS